MIEFKDVTFYYDESQINKNPALDQVNLEIKEGQFIGVIGHTGSGKSTLLQHMNGLLIPTSGEVLVDGISTKIDKKNLVKVRQKVGLVFQYPEHQLFEETIEKDIAFGAKNMGYSEEEIDKAVRDSMEKVKLDYESMKDLSPFEISGGQKRRVAIAGVLAMKPKYLILDEPTAGLDPRARDEILDEIYEMYQKSEDLTIVLVSHSMEDIARYANRLIVVEKGKILMDDEPINVFDKYEKLRSIGLDIPQIMQFMKAYKNKGNKVDDKIISVEKAHEEMKRFLGGIDE